LKISTRSCWLLAAGVLTVLPLAVGAQNAPTPPPAAAKPWYERVAIRGYGQIRYNRLFESNPDLKCEQCDKSWGDLGGVFIRRARVVISGQISPRVAIYLQPDFASSVGTSGH